MELHDPGKDEWWRQILWKLARIPRLGEIFEYFAETWGLDE